MSNIIAAAYERWDEEKRNPGKPTRQMSQIEKDQQYPAFGDKFLTKKGKIALYLTQKDGYAEFYVQGVGLIKVSVTTGDEIGGDFNLSISGACPKF